MFKVGRSLVFSCQLCLYLQPGHNGTGERKMKRFYMALIFLTVIIACFSLAPSAFAAGKGAVINKKIVVIIG